MPLLLQPCFGNASDPQCGYHNPLVGPIVRAKNDKLSQLWQASTGFFPSVYLPEGANASGFDAAANADYLAGVTAEASRLRDAHAPAAHVRPFAWAFYHAGDTLLQPWDMNSSLTVPPASGADGVLLWGNVVAFHTLPAFQVYFNETLGPLAKEQVAFLCGPQ